MREPLPHFVSDAPFDPVEAETLTADQEKFFMAGQWRMMWWRFRQHKLAMGAMMIAPHQAIMAVDNFLSTDHTEGLPPDLATFVTDSLVHVAAIEDETMK